MAAPQPPGLAPTASDRDRARLLRAAVDAAPDGLIVLDAAQVIGQINREALAIAGLRDLRPLGRPLAEVATDSPLNWAPVLDMLAEGRSGEVIIRSENIGSIFVTLRRIAEMPGAVLLTLRDLAVFDHARRMASGQRDPSTFASTVERRLRPDFARQRQLSPYLDRIIARGERALLQGARVIITGESGVGKTEIARHLHSFVSTATDPFVAVNCAAIPETLFESELFGYEKGAFTGALSEGKKGLIETAEGGTLFLDEIGEIPLTLQAKLLSFLEDGVFLRVGATCVTAPCARGNFRAGFSASPGADMCPASVMRRNACRGPVWCSKIRSRSKPRARRHSVAHWFSRSRLTTVAPNCSLPSYAPTSSRSTATYAAATGDR